MLVKRSIILLSQLFLLVACSKLLPDSTRFDLTAETIYKSRAPIREGKSQLAQPIPCLLTSEGPVQCWGANDFGQLGSDVGSSPEMFSKPFEVSGLASRVKVITSGAYHSCVILDTGGVQCWGQNSYGQLGDSTTTDRNMAVDVQGLKGDVLALTAGYAHTYALMQGGMVTCWGQNTYGQLGDGTTVDSTVPVEVVGLDGEVLVVSAGWTYTCAIVKASELICWGQGPFGDDPGLISTSPVRPLAHELKVKMIATGVYHICAVLNEGEMYCWGSIFSPEDPTGPQRYDTSDLTGKVVQIVAGADFNCVLITEGGVKCWGDNYFGQLGASQISSNTPVDALGLSIDVMAIGAGEYVACALTKDGAVKCWGDTSFGQLGEGTQTWK